MSFNDYLVIFNTIITLTLIFVMLDLKRQVYEIKENLKNPKFIKNLNLLIDDKTQEIFENKFIENVELITLLNLGLKKAKFHFSEILDRNFNFKDINKIKSAIIEDFKQIKRSINFDKFKNNISTIQEDSDKLFYMERYFTNLEIEILIPELENFIIKLIQITKELKNGIRRREYQKICIEMIENIMIKSIDKYNSYLR